ncbi:MAG: hypothetical protein KBD37_09820 [Burkholderiales bacterium]|nr:hypothetical protein [Burkholderiales bacterium]
MSIPQTSAIAQANELTANGVSDNLASAENMVVDLNSLDPATLANNAFGFVDSAYTEHNFLVGVLQDENQDDMSPEMLRTIQNELEKFTVKTQLIGKTVSVLLKDIDTLVKIQ